MSRFDFLEERFPKLAESGRKSEEAFEHDKNICLLNLGRIAEYITKFLCLQNNIHDGDADKLAELGIIDEKIRIKINALTEIKNDAVNDEYDSAMSCERLLITAEELCRWFMNEKGESKFSFLADLFPDSSPIPPLADLAVYGREAEENLFPNTRYSLICLGDIEESVVEFLLNMKGIDANPHDNDQSERINILYRNDIISRENKDILHELRMARNSAVHSRYNSIEEGRKLIDESIQLCEWLFRFIILPGNFIRGIISRVNDESLEVKAGRIQCRVEGEDIPESNESLIERYHEGEKRIFKVIDSQGEIIRLSIKEVYTDPWLNIARRYERYEIGQILNVKIMSISENFGAVAEIIGPLEITEARIPESEYGNGKPKTGHELKACVKWFSPATYPYMILSVKDVPAEKDFVSMCADSSPEEISAKIPENVDVNEKNHNGMTALMNAAMHNDNPEVIRVLIEAGAKVNAVNMNSSGNTALIFAAMYNTPEVVKALIESGADITVTNSEGMMAYDYALNNEKLKDSDVIDMLEVRKPLTHDEFIELCKNGSADEILNALKYPGLDLNSPDELGNTALMFACDSNNADAVNALLDSNADITLKNHNGFTAMDFALHNDKLKGTEIISRLMPEPSDERFIELCRTGDAEIIRTAINAGANLQARDSELNTALMNAIDARNHDAVKVLLGHKIEIDAQNTDGNNALILSVMNNDSEVLSALLHKNPELDCANKNGRTALMTAAEISTPEMISLLIDLGSDLNHADAHGNTALMIALEREDEDAMNTILEYGADADIQNDTGYNALMMAARTKSPDIVSRLIEITSDINARNKDGDTALTLAAVFNNADVINALLDAGADVNMQNKNGTTALMAALYNSLDSENVIRAILMRKPDLNLRNAMERTAFEIAIHKPNLAGSKTLIFLLKGEFLKLCGSGSEEEISLAIDAGADIHAKNKSQATCLMFASQKNTAGAAEILINAGSDIDAQDINGNTALIYASSYNNDDVLDVLIENGANVNIMNHAGHKALGFALRNYRLNDTEALRKLKELTHN